MTSKEELEIENMKSDLNDISFILCQIPNTEHLINRLEDVAEKLKRLEHYDSIKSDLGIFDRYKEDLQFICDTLNERCKDMSPEEWNEIAFKFQSFIGAVNVCQLQEGAYQENENLKEIINIISKYCRVVHFEGTDIYLFESYDVQRIPEEEFNKLKEVLHNDSKGYITSK